MSISRLTAAVWTAWKPPEPVSARDWVPVNIVIPDETETPGPFDLDLFPHVGGVLDAWDDPTVRVILLPWSSRLGKTVTGLSLLTFGAINAPRPAMIAREDKDRIDDLITAQFFPLLDACAAARAEIPPPHRRDPKNGIRFSRCRIRRAYSGSPATMAGFPACYALASEVSKWSKKRSSEADPIYLFKKRGMLFPFDSKYIFESTPGSISACNITELCSADGVDVRRRVVPCPHCGHWQELVWGTADPEGPGVKWEKRPDGRSDAAIAERTAWYRCENGCRIESTERAPMLRRGVWISQGQTIDDRGRVHGARPASSTVAFGHPIAAPFGALHSLVISGWGQLAKEWIEVKGTREGRREFANQTLGIVWDPTPLKVSADDLALRMGVDAPLGVCPAQTVFLTRGCDCGQAGDSLLFYWWVSAWWKGGGGQLVALGMAIGEDEFLALLREQAFPVAGSGASLKPVRTGVDSGSFTQAIYRLCKGLPGVWPMKGSSRDQQRPFVTAEFPEMYRPGIQAAGLPPRVVEAKRRARAYDLILPNTNRSQQWLEDRITGLVKRDAPDFFGIPLAALSGEILPGVNLSHHLLGDMQDERGNWIKRYDDQDFRDACRYAMVAAWEFVHNGLLWDQPPGSVVSPTERSVAPSPAERRSGRFRFRRKGREAG